LRDQEDGSWESSEDHNSILPSISPLDFLTTLSGSFFLVRKLEDSASAYLNVGIAKS